MNILEELKKILTELLDLENGNITPETYLIQELGAESIDLLEMAVAINSCFKIKVKDEEIFLTRFRLHLTEAEQRKEEAVPYVATKYPFLTEQRVEEIVKNIGKGPQLKVKDVMSYIAFHSKEV
jgi:acyl carrier protein